MAKTATAASAPNDDDTGPDAGAGSDTGAAGGDDTEQQPEVIATILCFPDGSFGLTQGDETEENPGEGAEGGGEESGAEPQRFNSVGELLHGVMQTVKDYESQKSGEGTEAENFSAGYSGAGGTQSKMAGA